MQLVSSGSLMAPNVCFICEQWGQKTFVDTFYSYEQGTSVKLAGRKYVCESCVTELAKFFDLTPASVRDEAVNEAEACRSAIKNLRYRLDTFSKELADLSRKEVFALQDFPETNSQEVVNAPVEAAVAVGSLDSD